MLTVTLHHDIEGGIVMHVEACGHWFWVKDGAALAVSCPVCTQIKAAEDARGRVCSQIKAAEDTRGKEVLALACDIAGWGPDDIILDAYNRKYGTDLTSSQLPTRE